MFKDLDFDFDETIIFLKMISEGFERREFSNDKEKELYRRFLLSVKEEVLQALEQQIETGNPYLIKSVLSLLNSKNL